MREREAAGRVCAVLVRSGFGKCLVSLVLAARSSQLAAVPLQWPSACSAAVWFCRAARCWHFQVVDVWSFMPRARNSALGCHQTVGID
ncbi:uncharacterized protein UV8b_05888 [Ustilaginoidea virens]|uniref:Uncharacterized protein n=1 Tax=Ustilaginoidea virens TaxID=1159556 RepID=A0A8E5HUH9_USTVR|nr:uncharacterized protein UV8b_05888 [Ustilaginoidea virens]QUC21645.1 hypothetical protein UV8b_05888 [Ustilaginoidea virens]